MPANKRFLSGLLSIFCFYQANSPSLTSGLSAQESLPSGSSTEQKDENGRHINVSPQARQIKREPVKEEFSRESIAPFFSRSRVIDEVNYIAAPRIYGGEMEKLLFSSGEKVYVSGEQDFDEGTYSVFRRGSVFTDPNSGEALGVEAIYLGEGSLEKKGPIAVLQLTRTIKEMRKGDVVLPTLSGIFSNLPLRRLKSQIRADVIGFLEDFSYSSQFQSVVINKGSRHSIVLGQLVNIYPRKKFLEEGWYRRLGRKLGLGLPRGVQTDAPEETRLTLDKTKGTIFIYRVFDKVSLGLVLSGTGEIAGDQKTLR